jgi:hypothetical protein
MDKDTERQILRHVSRARASGKEHSTTSLGDVTEADARRVMERTGIDIAGYEHILQSSDIRHVFRSHGDPATEAARGQIAIRKSDFLLIPTIIGQAHRITAIGRARAVKPLRLEYAARIDGHDYRYLKELRGARIVALKSILKKM